MNWFDRIGVGLISFGFLFSLLVGFGFIIGGPIFLVGTLIILFGKRNNTFKILWICLPILSFYPTSKAYYEVRYYLSDRSKVDLIFPENFVGSAIIVDNNDYGQTFEKKAFREQIYLENHGIVFYPTDFDFYRLRVFRKTDDDELRRVLWSYETSEDFAVLSKGKSRFLTYSDTNIRQTPYKFVRIGNDFGEQSNCEERSLIIQKIKEGQLEKAFILTRNSNED